MPCLFMQSKKFMVNYMHTNLYKILILKENLICKGLFYFFEINSR